MKMFSILFVVLVASPAQSQTWNEWFNQKRTKLKYIAQQIAAFEMYAGYLKKGYTIVDKGWNTIHDVKHDDYDLHNSYFNSLKKVNSSIANYDKVDGIINLQLQVLQVDDATKKFVKQNNNIHADEKHYITAVMTNLLAKCADVLDELKMLTTNGSLSMKDDERLKRIDDLDTDMQDKYAFAKYFQSSLQTLALSRAKGTNDVNTSKSLYGIKQ